MRRSRVILSTLVLVVMSLTLGGCKAQQQMQQQIADLDQRLQTSERRVNTLDGDLKKANMEIGTLKSLVQKLGNVIVDLQKVEEERQRLAQEARAKAEAAAAKMKKKPAPGKGKKKH